MCERRVTAFCESPRCRHSGVVATHDVETAFKDIEYAILLGGFPRKPGMERKELLSLNSPIFSTQGKAFDRLAAPNAKAGRRPSRRPRARARAR